MEIMVMRSWMYGTVLSVGFSGVMACQSASEPEAKPVATSPTPAPLPKVLRGSMHGLGPITSTVAPTVEAIRAVLDDRYTVRTSEEGPDGSTVQVLFDGRVVLDVFGDADSSRIARAVSSDKHVVFPWNTTVGTAIGEHKHWDRMSCMLEPAPYQGKARCFAYEAGRISYFVDGWEGEATTLPGKELVASLTISEVVWKPTYESDGEAGE
jgi:hypothetical protein